jgi:dienelactone hydrolase
MSLSLSAAASGAALYGPATGDDLPGIVLLHGSEGPGAGWAHRFAAILAAEGFLALPHAYGTGDVWGAGPVRDVALEPAVAAGRELAAHPRCSGRVGLFGWSLGGQKALLLAALWGAELPYAAVAAHAPSDVVTGAFDPAVFRAGGAWRQTGPEAPRAWVAAGQEDALAPGTPIAVERYPGPVFLSVGLADAVWDPGQSARLAARRRALGLPVTLWQAEGQGHAFDWDTEPELWRRLGGFFRDALSA